MNGDSTRTRIRCATLRHAEMPKGSRRVPNVYPRFILGPSHGTVGRLEFFGGSTAHPSLTTPTSLLHRFLAKFTPSFIPISSYPQLIHFLKSFLPPSPCLGS